VGRLGPFPGEKRAAAVVSDQDAGLRLPGRRVKSTRPGGWDGVVEVDGGRFKAQKEVVYS
jgi:hypothetical protein